MSTLKTFISALKTGETRTTKALEDVARKRKSAAALALIAELKEKDALNKPLSATFRQAITKTSLPAGFIDTCIDGWPDTQKEEARGHIVWAIKRGGKVKFRWGLKVGAGYDAKFKREGDNVTITALSPRSSLKISGGEIYAAPAKPPQ
jgi:hypothetical protein